MRRNEYFIVSDEDGPRYVVKYVHHYCRCSCLHGCYDDEVYFAEVDDGRDIYNLKEVMGENKFFIQTLLESAKKVEENDKRIPDTLRNR